MTFTSPNNFCYFKGLFKHLNFKTSINKIQPFKDGSFKMAHPVFMKC